MANTVTALSYANTFGDWVVATNSLIGENNILAGGDYNKTSGTLYLNETVQNSLQANGTVVVQKQLLVQGIGSSGTIQNNLTVGGQVYFTNTTLGLTNSGQANIDGLLLAQGPNIGLSVSNNAFVAGNTTIRLNTITNILQANSIVNTANASITGTTYSGILQGNTRTLTGILTANTNVYTDVLQANNRILTEYVTSNTKVFTNFVQANSSLLTGILTANTNVYTDVLQSNTSVTTNFSISNTALTGILQANTLANTQTLSVTQGILTNSLQANNSITTPVINANTLVIAANIISNSAISATGNIFSNRLQANTNITAGAIQANTSVVGNNIIGNIEISSPMLSVEEVRANSSVVVGSLTVNTSGYVVGSLQVGGDFTILGRSLLDANEILLKSTNKQTPGLGFDYISVNRTNSSGNFDGVNDYIYSPSHGFSTGQNVSFSLLSSSISVIANNVTYRVLNQNTNYFQVATTASPSTPINFTGSGSGTVTDLDNRNAQFRWNEPQEFWDILNVDNGFYYRVITSQLLNDTVTNTSTELVATANSVNAASINAAIASVYANGAFVQANSGYTHSNSAFTQANTATNNAAGASLYANGAFIQANAAFLRANTPDAIANSAALYANGAFVQANAAYNSQNTTGTYANSAYAQANTATNNAAGASLYANGAFVQANTATNNAAGASLYANGAFIQANAAFLRANTPDAIANSAALYANGAFVQANASFGTANTATNNAAGASLYANGAFIQANASFVVANNAANTLLTYSNPSWITSLAAAKITGLAASATTDTTNATNISSGTLSASRLPTSGVVATSVGSASSVSQFTVDTYGRITTANSIAIAISSGAVSGLAASATTDTTSATNITSGTLSAVRLGTTGNPQFNSIGVGTAASGTAGTIRATSDITAFFTSDIKFKENVVPIPNALEKVLEIGGKLFDWKDDYITEKGGEDGYFIRKSDFGLIAQDVERVFPLGVRKKPDGTLAVDYEKLCALAFQAIIELNEKIDKNNN